jgi:formylglycine-generating enzyme
MEFHFTWQFGRIFIPLLGLLYRSGFFDPAVYLSVMTIPAIALFAWMVQRAQPEISAASTSKLARGLRYFLYFFMCWMAMNSFAAGFKTMIVEELAYQERKWFEPYLPALHFFAASAFLVDVVLVGKPIIGRFRLLAACYLQFTLLAGYGAAIYRVWHEDAEGAIGGIILLVFFVYRNYVLAKRLYNPPPTRQVADAAALLAGTIMHFPRATLYALAAWAIVLALFFASNRQEHEDSSEAASSHGTRRASTDIRSPALVPEMVRIPAGEFLMGSSSLSSDEGPVHEVFLDEYYIGKFEVTNAQYKTFCKATGRPCPQPRWDQHSSRGTSDELTAKPTYPVVDVSWDDALAYCEWLSRTTVKKYRLPTEAEWEKAARGGLYGKKYPWGDEAYDANGHYRANAGSEAENERIRKKDGFSYTAPVGSFPPNGYGLYDMAGNVWEWCADFYDGTYYVRSAYKNPQGPERGEKRVIRGGSWFGGPEHMENAARLWDYESIRYASTGFRVAMTP